MRLNKINCTSVVEHVCEELDEDINSAACRVIKRHLKSCPNCTAYLDSLKKTVLIYRHTPNPRFPAKARKQLFATLKINA